MTCFSVTSNSSRPGRILLKSLLSEKKCTCKDQHEFIIYVAFLNALKTNEKSKHKYIDLQLHAHCSFMLMNNRSIKFLIAEDLDESNIDTSNDQVDGDSDKDDEDTVRMPSSQ
jgi:hypothetical protein